jgi:hypothetical protein
MLCIAKKSRNDNDLRWKADCSSIIKLLVQTSSEALKVKIHFEGYEGQPPLATAMNCRVLADLFKIMIMIDNNLQIVET